MTDFSGLNHGTRKRKDCDSPQIKNCVVASLISNVQTQEVQLSKSTADSSA